MIRSVKKCSNDHLTWNENQRFSVVCRRGSMLSTAIFVYAATSPVNGYFGGSLYAKQGGNKRSSFAVLSPKPLKLTWFYLNMAGRRWIKQMFIGAFLIPSMVCGTAFFINFIAIYYHASRAIPFGTMVSFTFIVLKERRLVFHQFVAICSWTFLHLSVASSEAQRGKVNRKNHFSQHYDISAVWNRVFWTCWSTGGSIFCFQAWLEKTGRRKSGLFCETTCGRPAGTGSRFKIVVEMYESVEFIWVF